MESDALYQHRDALQDHLFVQAQALLGFGQTITLYDLTNTYFEGLAAGVDKAKRGRSKEKRSDCPLVTLAMVLDGSALGVPSSAMPERRSTMQSSSRKTTQAMCRPSLCAFDAPATQGPGH